MNTLIDVAVADGRFKTLAAAPTAAGLIAGKVSTQGGVKLNGEVNVTKTDIAASNGLIHVVDAVLLPSA